MSASYSPDGRFISWAQNVRPVFRLWGADGRDVTPSTVVPFMTVWSDAGLYFGDSKGIEVYRTGVVSPFLPGATWIRPKASAGGGQILYEARDGSGLGHAYLVDTTSGKARDLGQGRAEPQFSAAWQAIAQDIADGWGGGDSFCVWVFFQ